MGNYFGYFRIYHQRCDIWHDNGHQKCITHFLHVLVIIEKNLVFIEQIVKQRIATLIQGGNYFKEGLKKGGRLIAH